VIAASDTSSQRYVRFLQEPSAVADLLVAEAASAETTVAA